MKIFKWVYGKSKWLHKFIGLFILLFLIWSSVSGIILNHPDLVSGISVPGWMVPGQYRTENWNRSSLVKMVFSEKDPNLGFAAGKRGVWKTVDGGMTFERMDDGYPHSLYYGKANDILLAAGGDGNDRLFASLFGGLWSCDLPGGKWEKIFPVSGHVEVKKVLDLGNRLAAFTSSGVFTAEKDRLPYDFREIKIRREGEEKTERVSLVRLFFDLHGGHAWGIAGRIIFDIAGLMIIFLSVSAFYIWYFPRRLKRTKRNKDELRPAFGFLYKYHLKLGIWTAVILLLIGITAFFMRPPFLAAIAMGDIDVSLYPGHFPENPWDGRIHNAVHMTGEGKVLIEADDGIWEGNSDFSGYFRKVRMPVLIFVMGATVFEEYHQGGLLVGSFNGIFHIPGNGSAIDLITGKPVRWVSPVRPAEKMVSGYFRTPGGEAFITAFEQGIIPLDGAEKKGRFRMPDELAADDRLPLWNYMFELHNGRIFEDLIGNWYLLIIPLGSFLFILLTLTGIYDWFYSALKKKRKPESESGKISAR